MSRFAGLSPRRLFEEKLISFLESCKTLKPILQIQSQIVIHDLQQNGHVARRVVYACCRAKSIHHARQVFDRLSLPHFSIWNAMFLGYSQYREFPTEILLLYKKMRSTEVMPDCITLPIVIIACTRVKNLRQGEELHCFALKRGIGSDTYIGSMLIEMYSSSGVIDSANRVFREMVVKDVVAWNIMIKWYAQKNMFCEVIDCFKNMVYEQEVIPNAMSLTLVLSACGKSADIEFGKWVHTYGKCLGHETIEVNNALIGMYAKCGDVGIAMKIFNGMKERDIVSWNSIIHGLGLNGHGKEAINLFNEMQNNGITPNGVTFIGVLSSCVHMGMLTEGTDFYNSMTNDFSIEPQIEHCCCMVDLLGRTGNFTEAVEFINKFPIKADSVVWTALLGAAKTHNNVEIAQLAVKELQMLEPNDPSFLVALRNIYLEAEMFDEAVRLQDAMRHKGFKEAGVSWVLTDDGLVGNDRGKP